MPQLETIPLVSIAVLAVAFFGLLLVITRLYVRASKETSFVRTGMGGQKVVVNGGTLVLPIFHEIIRVNMNTLRLEVNRAASAALITKDRMRVDVQAEFYVRVKPTEDAIADAAQTLGQRTVNPDALKELVEGKFVDALRAVAAEMTMEELHEKRVDFVQRVQTTVAEDILKNGLELESVSLTALDQTSQEFLNPQNAFDAQGLAKLTEIIEAKRKMRNDIEQETRIQIQQKNLEAEQRALTISKEQEYARMEQEREVAIRRAAQAAEIAREQAARDQEAKQAEIAARQQIQQTEILSQRKVEEDRIATAKAVETIEIEKVKSLELAEQDRAIAIAEKSRAKSEAEALAAAARAEAVKAEEQVITVREREIAERKKTIELVQASETAEKEAIRVTVAAEAEKKSSLDRAEAAKLIAQGEADAERLRAEASAKRYEVDAIGRRALNEAENILSTELVAAQIRKVLIEKLPEIIRESVKPMEQIDGIKIIQVDGITGGGSGTGSSIEGSGNLADNLVNSALRYRGQAPLVDALMREIGLAGGDVNGLTKALVENVAPVPTGNGHATTPTPTKASTEPAE